MGSRSVTARRGWIPVGHPSLLIAVLCTAGVCVSLMQTLIIPIIPELPKLLDTTPDNASWVITATLLTAAVATPVFGRLGDMYGPKRMLVACSCILTAGSVLAATSASLWPVIIGRGMQGFGMPIIPLGISVLRACVPPDRVGSAMATMSASLGVGAGLGLPLAAVIAENFNWLALFWLSAAMGATATVLFATLVPTIPAVSLDRFDPLGALLLAGGLVTLLLPISKGGSWGWTSSTTLILFGSSLLIFAAFAAWQLWMPSPIVDLRTSMRRPVLTTNLASIGVGFSLFATSLVAPQILELPTETGHGLAQSMLHTGLWLAPGGLTMMVVAPLAARVAARRGPRFTLVGGCAVIAASYLSGLFMLSSAPLMMVFNICVSIGVGFAFSSLPMLINAAVPISETAAANGINSLARALGTSISSAVVGAVLAGMTIRFNGHDVPSLAGFQVTLLIAAGAAVIAGLVGLLIPVTRAEPESTPELTRTSSA